MLKELFWAKLFTDRGPDEFFVFPSRKDDQLPVSVFDPLHGPSEMIEFPVFVHCVDRFLGGSIPGVRVWYFVYHLFCISPLLGSLGNSWSIWLA